MNGSADVNALPRSGVIVTVPEPVALSVEPLRDNVSSAPGGDANRNRRFHARPSCETVWNRQLTGASVTGAKKPHLSAADIASRHQGQSWIPVVGS